MGSARAARHGTVASRRPGRKQPRREGRASVSVLQRKFRIGYPRAAGGVDVMQVDISQKGTDLAAVLIRPRFGPSGPYDFQRQEQFAAAGEEAAREALPQLRAFLPWLSAQARPV